MPCYLSPLFLTSSPHLVSQDLKQPFIRRSNGEAEEEERDARGRVSTGPTLNYGKKGVKAMSYVLRFDHCSVVGPLAEANVGNVQRRPYEGLACVRTSGNEDCMETKRNVMWCGVQHDRSTAGNQYSLLIMPI
ncbi:hypothetical protein NDA13_000844 [Ustilago tritici]|nr:hypothetical protein NDA13_000844 [Ustilago tritici]